MLGITIDKLAVFLLVVVAVGQAIFVYKDECPPNEEYLLCGSACAANCSIVGKPVSCTAQCIEGCFCKPDYLRDDKGICVKPEQCTPPIKCGDNEEFSSCGTSCPATCDQPEPELCDQVCRIGCFCKGNTVRDSNGKCVDVADCPSVKCPPNEEYQVCGSACPANCTNLDQPDVCTEQCVEGCFCNPGLVRDDKGNCVKPDQCTPPPQCGENEEFSMCGSSCPATCDQPEPAFCDRACRVGCFCKGTAVRDGSGKCVDVENCPSEPCLNKNEVYDVCRAACEPSCSDPDPICTKICVGGCVCAPGLFRDDGKCVPADKCANATDISYLKKYMQVINNLLHLSY